MTGTGRTGSDPEPGRQLVPGAIGEAAAADTRKQAQRGGLSFLQVNQRRPGRDPDGGSDPEPGRQLVPGAIGEAAAADTRNRKKGGFYK